MAWRHSSSMANLKPRVLTASNTRVKKKVESIIWPEAAPHTSFFNKVLISSLRPMLKSSSVTPKLATVSSVALLSYPMALSTKPAAKKPMRGGNLIKYTAKPQAKAMAINVGSISVSYSLFKRDQCRRRSCKYAGGETAFSQYLALGLPLLKLKWFLVLLESLPKYLF